MAHWVYFLAVASGSTAFAVWRLARAFLLIVGGLTTNPQRSKQVERMIILSRGDAKEILAAQAGPPKEDGQSPATEEATETDAGSTRAALESVPDMTATPATQQRPAPRRRRPRPPRQ